MPLVIKADAGFEIIHVADGNGIAIGKLAGQILASLVTNPNSKDFSDSSLVVRARQLAEAAVKAEELQEEADLAASS